jgi:hypothetical protein
MIRLLEILSLLVEAQMTRFENLQYWMKAIEDSLKINERSELLGNQDRAIELYLQKLIASAKEYQKALK